jgi:hypothetical protein
MSHERTFADAAALGRLPLCTGAATSCRGAHMIAIVATDRASWTQRVLGPDPKLLRAQIVS